MQKVPLDLLEQYLPHYLDPKDLSEFSGISKNFTRFRKEKYISNEYKNDALVYACFKGHKDLAEWLIDVKGETFVNRAFCWACKGGHQHIAQWLIDEKGAVGHWGILWACYGGHKELVKWLVKTNVDPDIKRGITWAVKNGHKELADWLRKRTWRINLKNKSEN